jgi:hypothetical protein
MKMLLIAVVAALAGYAGNDLRHSTIDLPVMIYMEDETGISVFTGVLVMYTFVDAKDGSRVRIQSPNTIVNGRW